MQATSVRLDLNALSTLERYVITIEMYEGKDQDNKRLIVSSKTIRELELDKDLLLIEKHDYISKQLS